jgi:hypothetical protein
VAASDGYSRRRHIAAPTSKPAIIVGTQDAEPGLSPHRPQRLGTIGVKLDLCTTLKLDLCTTLKLGPRPALELGPEAATGARTAATSDIRFS